MVTATRSNADLQTRDIRGVEILTPGKWNGRPYTSKELDQAVEAFDELGPAGTGQIRPPGKLGHDPDQALAQADGYPAIGWISKLYRSGRKLLADFSKVPAKVADLIAAGAYDLVSSEVYLGLELNDKTYPFVIKAVSFLGADSPAVKDISSISDVAALFTEPRFPGLVVYHAEHVNNAVSAEQRKAIPDEDFAGPDRTFPIDTQEHLDSAATLIGHAADPAAVKAKAIAIAKRHGLTLPDSWTTAKNSAADPDNDGDDDRPGSTNNPDADEDKKQGIVGADGDAGGDGDEGDLAEDTHAAAMAAHAAYAKQLEGIIAGKPGAKKVRTFMAATKNQLASMAPKPVAKNTEVTEMTTKELAEMLGLPLTATEDEVKAAIQAKKAPEPTPEPKADESKLTEALAQIAELKADQKSARIATLIDTAVSEGKSWPAEREDLVAIGLLSEERLVELLKRRPKIGKLSGPLGVDVKPEAAEAPSELEAGIASILRVGQKDLTEHKAQDVPFADRIHAAWEESAAKRLPVSA